MSCRRVERSQIAQRPMMQLSLRGHAGLLLFQHAIDDVASRDQQNPLEFRIVDSLGLLLNLADQIQSHLEVGQLWSFFL